MPVFQVEQYEVHSMTYQIEADDVAQAIVKLFDGEGEPVANSLEYVEIADERGLWSDEHPKLAEQLRSHGLPVDQVIPTIRSVSQLEPSLHNTISKESA